MLTNTAVTLGSLVINLNASSIALAVAPPPQSSISPTIRVHTKEIGRFTAIEFDDIHSCHCESSTIHKTPNRSLSSETSIIFG